VITAAEIKALLAQELASSGKAVKISVVLKRGELVIPLHALEAGRATVQWYQVPVGATLSRKVKAKPTLVAFGTLRFTSAGTGALAIKVTLTGRKLLKHARRATLTAKGTFAPAGAPPITATARIVLKR
jgi:hypothetical protein